MWSHCNHKAVYRQCNVRIIIENDIHENVAKVQHYGYHECVSILKGHPDNEMVTKSLLEYRKQTGESITRLAIQNVIESPTGTYKDAVNVTKQFTDIKYLENPKKMVSNERRPDGHNYGGIKKFYERYRSEDKYLLYDFADVHTLPFIFKSSLRKVHLLSLLNRDADHRLS